MSLKETKILICDPIHEDGIKILKESDYSVCLKTSITEKELIETIKDYDAIIVRSRTKISKEILDVAEKLRVIARAGVGLDNIDLKEADEKGVKVINSPEASSNAVAELVVGYILSLARNIPKADRNMKIGKWIKKDLQGFELKSKVLGIIGFGRIGYLLAKKAKALEMRVLTYDIIIDKLMDYVEDAGAEAVSFNELLAQSDFVSIHVPLLPQTRYMIGRKEIESMKNNAYLINASRGAIVDENALREALLNRDLAGAALDVYEKEPPDDTSLTGLDNVVCTPHIGAATKETQRANSIIIAESLIEFLKDI